MRTDRGELSCRAVVLATGAAAKPRVPAAAAGLSPRVEQRTAADYKNPRTLAPGGVLIVRSESVV